MKTQQADCTQPFPQAELEDPVFMQIPEGWCIEDGKLIQHENPSSMTPNIT
jgi:hypothetical protein